LSLMQNHPSLLGQFSDLRKQDYISEKGQQVLIIEGEEK
jgi:hypothetical protein